MIDIWGVPVVADVEDILDGLIIELRASGSHLLKDKMRAGYSDIMLTCIAHGGGIERKPSLGVLTEDKHRPDANGKMRTYKAGTVNCFTCGYTKGLPEFISDCFGLDDLGQYGYKWIMSNFVNLSIENREDIALDMRREHVSDALEALVSDEELESYRFTHPYMYERKLTDRVIDYFDVGYDKKTRSLTFPVHHHVTGQALFIQRRAVSGKRFQNDETIMKAATLYGLYQVYRNLSWIKELYITESIIDALTLWTHRKAAVATMQAIPTGTQIELLRKLPIRKLINAQDNDKAGDKGAKRIKEALGSTKLISRAIFPKGVKDINELHADEIESIQDDIL